MYCIGLDIGGTKCAVSVGKVGKQKVDILERYEVATNQNPKVTLAELSIFVMNWIKRYKVRTMGISCGGPLDSEKGIILTPPNLSSEWHNFAIISYVKSHFGIEAKLENDANASAIAEWKFGAGKGKKNVIFMTFGTGLGAGLILDGKLYSGSNGNAGEVGHLRLEREGPIGFNKVGSAEGFCSGNGIKRLAKIRAKEHNFVLPEEITTKEIFQKAREGVEFYFSIVKESAEKFAQVISMLIDLLNPDVIIAGGVFMRNYELFMPIMRPILEKESLTASYNVCKILPARIGENIGDYAALAVATMGE